MACLAAQLRQRAGRSLQEGGRRQIFVGMARNVWARDDLDGLPNGLNLTSAEGLPLLELPSLEVAVRSQVPQVRLVRGLARCRLHQRALGFLRLGRLLAPKSGLLRPGFRGLLGIVVETLGHELKAVLPVHLLLLHLLPLVLEVQAQLLEHADDAVRLEFVSICLRGLVCRRRALFLRRQQRAQRLLGLLGQAEVPAQVQQARDGHVSGLQDRYSPLQGVNRLGEVLELRLEVIALLLPQGRGLRLLGSNAVQLGIQLFNVLAELGCRRLCRRDLGLEGDDVGGRLLDRLALLLRRDPAELREGRVSNLLLVLLLLAPLEHAREQLDNLLHGRHACRDAAAARCDRQQQQRQCRKPSHRCGRPPPRPSLLHYLREGAVS
mmetsp:Transcript_53314/g.152825  ORF Transcript_53314/g.152825 Transcript_53314/m.152825 type:complete len:379 (+) Transcript_53314:1018-2154(+)